MPKELIYIADDEVKIQELIKMFLKKEGYEVCTFSEGDALLKAFLERPADMLILDVMMPGIDGLSLCSEIRKENEVPIIIISAKDSDSDKIAGLMLGSDDYLTKPFSPVELVLRVKKIFKLLDRDKEGKAIENSLRILDLTAYVDGKYVVCNGEKLKLTPMEFNLLLYLMQNCNKGVSRNELLNKLWGFDCEVDTRATDDMIKRIRKKLSDANSELKIETLWGFGFMISDMAK
ncbi:MAG: response regulator transcription factor [Solirubrobacterales bacterium]